MSDTARARSINAWWVSTTPLGLPVVPETAAWGPRNGAGRADRQTPRASTPGTVRALPASCRPVPGLPRRPR
ncbi:hypothetical protein G6F68_020148 [Rhizopus microsporus]|nr:hypothetical protein G6F68_020148 [Rhizopus microsporus]